MALIEEKFWKVLYGQVKSNILWKRGNFFFSDRKGIASYTYNIDLIKWTQKKLDLQRGDALIHVLVREGVRVLFDLGSLCSNYFALGLKIVRKFKMKRRCEVRQQKGKAKHYPLKTIENSSISYPPTCYISIANYKLC